MKTVGMGLIALLALGQANITQADSTKLATDTLQAFESLFGVTPAKRRNHTKGFCFEGTLSPADKSITAYSNSPLFQEASSVIGRLSHKDGVNAAPDNKPAEYGMGLAISTESGAKQLMSMNTLDFFPVATPEAFAELMQAKVNGGDAVKAFKAGNKDLQRFKQHEASDPKNKTLTPYEGATYNSINSFHLVNTAGEKTAVRWSFVPVKAQAIVLEPAQDFFLENMQSNLQENEIAWNMVITLANPDDAVDNAAIAWTGEHKQITAATLTVKSVSTEQDGRCDAINFDPLVLAQGFAPSADPLLAARRSIYAVSFGKRLSEKQ